LSSVSGPPRKFISRCSRTARVLLHSPEPLEDLLQDRKLLVGRCQLRLKRLYPRARPVRNIPALSPTVLMVAMSNVDPLTPVARTSSKGLWLVVVGLETADWHVSARMAVARGCSPRR
jgi:hypothetical protein